MKIKDVIKKPFYIQMAQHGVKGVAIEVTDKLVQDNIREVRKFQKRDKISNDELKAIHAKLASELTKMLPDIMRHGSAVDSTGEFYDRQTFDDDCVALAVYDHLANGTPIGITDTIGPRPGDKVH